MRNFYIEIGWICTYWIKIDTMFNVCRKLIIYCIYMVMLISNIIISSFWKYWIICYLIFLVSFIEINEKFKLTIYYFYLSQRLVSLYSFIIWSSNSFFSFNQDTSNVLRLSFRVDLDIAFKMCLIAVWVISSPSTFVHQPFSSIAWIEYFTLSPNVNLSFISIFQWNNLILF